MKNLWDECYDTVPEIRVSPEEHINTFCKNCRNLGCSQSAVNKASWVNRISTQEDRLLIHPKFADPNQYSDLPDFESLFQQAMAIEISSQKGDWSIPTEQEISDMSKAIPAAFMPKDPEHIGQVFEVKSSDKTKTYHVTLQDDVWTCDCPAFVMGRARPCKHIQDVLARQEDIPALQKQAPASHQRESAPPPNLGKAIYPAQKNAPTPQPQIMMPRPTAPLNHPVADPWAAPSPSKRKDVIIPIGGKIVLGGK